MEDYIEGFTNVFDENDKINATITVDKIHGVQFDQTFGNLPFTAEATLSFSNPIETSFSSAEAKIAFKGIAEINVNDKLGLDFTVSQERLVVTSLHPYFLSDTTVKEFEKEFTKNLPKQFLQLINAKLAEGLQLPLGLDDSQSKHEKTIQIHEGYVVISEKPSAESSSGSKFELSHYQTYDLDSDEVKLRSYPIAHEVNKNKVIKKFVHGERSYVDSEQPLYSEESRKQSPGSR